MPIKANNFGQASQKPHIDMVIKAKPSNAPFQAIQLQNGAVKLDKTGCKVVKFQFKRG